MNRRRMVTQRIDRRLNPPLHFDPHGALAHVPPVVDGFRTERLLSQGMAGLVLLARHPITRERVVLKLLHPHRRCEPAGVARIWHESAMLTRLRSERIVRLLGTGWTQENGPYLILEFLEGIDVARLIEKHGALPLPLAIDYALRVCEALATVHDAGVVHHDIKPENLVVTCGEEYAGLKLLDFGICRSAPRSRSSVAQANAGALIGTASYMSPERIADLPDQDQRSDIWSMGVLLHELLTGCPPFGKGNDSDVCARVLAGQVSLERDPKILPSAVRAVIERCLRPNPGERFGNVRELASALRASLTMPDAQRGWQTGQFRTGALSRLAPVERQAPQPRHPWPRRAGVTLMFLLVASLGLWIGAGLPGNGEIGGWLSAHPLNHGLALESAARWFSMPR